MFRDVIFHFSRFGGRFILSEWHVKEYIVSHNSVAKKSCERSCRNPASRLSRATCTSPWRDEGKIAWNDFLLLFLLFFRLNLFSRSTHVLSPNTWFLTSGPPRKVGSLGRWCYCGRNARMKQKGGREEKEKEIKKPKKFLLWI